MVELMNTYYYNSKYTYRNNEYNNMFIFEVILKKKFNNNLILNKIKDCKVGNLLNIEDNIEFNNINKLIIKAIDIKNPLNELNVIYDFNKNKVNKIDNRYQIEINNNNNILEINYNFINI